MEAGVFEDQHPAVGQRGNRLRGDRADAVGGEGDRPAEHVGERRRDRAQRQRVIDPLRPAEVRQDDDPRARVGEERERRHRRRQPRHVADPAPVHRHVEVRPDENPPARHVADVVEGAKHQPSDAINVAVSTMRFEKPHSLSYQLTTRTSL